MVDLVTHLIAVQCLIAVLPLVEAIVKSRLIWSQPILGPFVSSRGEYHHYDGAVSPACVPKNVCMAICFIYGAFIESSINASAHTYIRSQ